jgi:hypothetical protein
MCFSILETGSFNLYRRGWTTEATNQEIDKQPSRGRTGSIDRFNLNVKLSCDKDEKDGNE